jgi:hypothetical protein
MLTMMKIDVRLGPTSGVLLKGSIGVKAKTLALVIAVLGEHDVCFMDKDGP